MKRDLELLREILLEIEANDKSYGNNVTGWDKAEISNLFPNYHFPEVMYNFDQLVRMGYVDTGVKWEVGIEVRLFSSKKRLVIAFDVITPSGHDFIDAIRSDTVWTKTKEGAATVGGMTLGMIKDLAIAYLKKEVSEKLSIPL